MFLFKILFDIGNGNLFLGYLSETEIVLISGICLFFLAIGLRWFLGRNDQMQHKTEGVSKR